MADNNAEQLKRIARLYLGKLIPIVRDKSLKRVPYTYFIDPSILGDDLTDLFSSPLWNWHTETTSWIGDWKHLFRKRLLRRFVPIFRREYSEIEQRLIKFIIHIQLSLGTEVVLYFTDDKAFLLNTFGSDNFAIVKGHFVIDTINPYHAAPADAMIVETRKSSVSDRFSTIEDLANDADRAFILKYSDNVFTNGRYAIPKAFAHALYNMQEGRCSIDGSRLGIAGFHLDHIIPLGLGGNNSLINLQVCDPTTNIKKGIEVNCPRFCFSLEERICFGFETIYHERFSDRMLKGIKPSPDALYMQNLLLR